ncbi:GNAT family N-acetyltransferase [Actinoplanes couchii]|uniref:GNAT family N-acetyltransferase n=1 Tax=Actinoplanes couchii TaxID=403638 RepID=UPI0035A24463
MLPTARDRGTSRPSSRRTLDRQPHNFEEPEIGYEIRATPRGHCYATEAARAVLQQFRVVGLTRMWATIRPPRHRVTPHRHPTRHAPEPNRSRRPR